MTVDVSFISVRLLLEPLRAVAPGARWLIMVKPQFEVGRDQVGKGGVVRDDALRAQAGEQVRAAIARAPKVVNLTFHIMSGDGAGRGGPRAHAPRGHARAPKT